MSALSDINEQLMVLKGLTRTTGCLHEAQITQMKLWPVFLFPKIKYEIRIDQEKKSIEYHLTFASKAPKSLQEKLAELDRSLQWLLGLEWQLKVSVGGKSVYKGTRSIAKVNQAEQKAYQPFISAIDKYIDKNWKDKK